MGRFLTDKAINFPAMKNTMAALWRPEKGICIKDLSPTLFLFQFFHEVDIQRVLDSGLWTFDQHVLIMKRLGTNEQPQSVPLFHTSFWVQVYNLPIGFLTAKVLQNIGNFIGEFQSFDANNFMRVWRNYMRIRVLLDVRKPLKRRMHLKKGGEWMWIEFRYERLNIFCFICGLLGHTEKLCPKLYDCDLTAIPRPYGQGIKAPNRHNVMASGERWLRSRLLEGGESLVGSCVTSGGSRAASETNPTIPDIPKHDDSSGMEVNENKELQMVVVVGKPTYSQLNVKGKDVAHAYNEDDLLKEGVFEFGQGMIVKETKRRWAQLGLEFTGGIEVDGPSHLMNIDVDPKNGLTVGPVFQAHRQQ